MGILTGLIRALGLCARDIIEEAGSMIGDEGEEPNRRCRELADRLFNEEKLTADLMKEVAASEAAFHRVDSDRADISKELEDLKRSGSDARNHWNSEMGKLAQTVSDLERRIREIARPGWRVDTATIVNGEAQFVRLMPIRGDGLPDSGPVITIEGESSRLAAVIRERDSLSRDHTRMREDRDRADAHAKTMADILESFYRAIRAWRGE